MNPVGKFFGHVENSSAFSRYRDIDEKKAKEAILNFELE